MAVKLLILITLLIVSRISFSDVDCSSREDLNEYDYELMCNNGEEGAHELKAKINKEIAFFNKWRRGIDKPSEGVETAENIEQDMNSINELIENAEKSIEMLASAQCEFEEYPGRVVSGSGSYNRPLCEQAIKKKLLIELLEKASEYSTIQKPSFDCEQAKSKIEIKICQSAELSSLDSRISEAYLFLTLKGNQSIANDQKLWIKNTRNQCSDALDLSQCLSEAMTARLIELSD